MADRLIEMTEETRAIAMRIEAEPIVWVTKSRLVAGGEAECDVVNFEGEAQSLNCVALWQQELLEVNLLIYNISPILLLLAPMAEDHSPSTIRCRSSPEVNSTLKALFTALRDTWAVTSLTFLTRGS